MKRLFAIALLSAVALLSAAGSASAQCAPPYCPAPTATINAASSVTDTTAALSGAVNPNGAPSSTWQIELSTFASFSQGVVVVASGSSGPNPTAVSGTATGLQPNTTYYARVAITTIGGGPFWSAPTSFTTAGTPSVNPPVGPGGGGNEPSGNAPVDPNRVSIEADPRRDRDRPFEYAISGGVEVDDGALCAAGGRVTISFRHDGEIIRERNTQLDADCGYDREIGIPKRLLPRGERDSGRLRVQAEFSGNRALNGKSSERISVRYG